VEKEFLYLISQDLPESIVETLVLFALLHLRFEPKKFIIVAILQTFTNLVRLLPIAFGMHTMILMISLTIYTRIFTKEKLSKILTSVVLIFAFSVTMQTVYIPLLLKITNLSLEYIASSPALRAALSLPYELALLGIALILNNKNKKLNRFTTQ